jgi:hypothetical protein
VAVLGTPSSSGNSANRTATGIQTQAAATNTRLMHLVENIEAQVLVPLYHAFLYMNQQFLPTDKLVQITMNGQPIQFDPVHILNASVKFRITASTKMRSQMVLMQVLPMILEMVLNPQLVTQMGQTQGMTLDVDALFEYISNALRVPFKSLFRQMTPQEMQAFNQPPAEAQLRMQMQRERLQSQEQTADENNDAKLLDTAFKGHIKLQESQLKAESQKEIAKLKPKPAPKKK